MKAIPFPVKSCPATVTVGSDVYALLAGPGGSHEPMWEFECELEPNHPGAHYSEGQAFGTLPESLWIRWLDTGLVDVIELPHCGSQYDAGDDDPRVCHLYKGHPGNHHNVEFRW